VKSVDNFNGSDVDLSSLIGDTQYPSPN